MSNYAQIEVKPLAANEELLRAFSYIGVTCGCIVWRMLDLSWGKLFANDGSYSVEKWQKDLMAKRPEQMGKRSSRRS